MAAGIEHVAARQVQRQRQAECLAGADLARTLEHLRFGQQVEPAQLVVGAVVAPVRALGTLLPAWHRFTPSGSRRPRGCRLPVVPSWKRSEEHTSELQSLMSHSYAVFC